MNRENVEERVNRALERMERGIARTRMDKGRKYIYVGLCFGKSTAEEIKKELKGKYHIRIWKSEDGSLYRVFISLKDSETDEKPKSDEKKEEKSEETDEKPKTDEKKEEKPKSDEALKLESEAKRVLKFLKDKNFKAKLSDVKSIIAGKNANILLRGATSTGKSTLVRFIAEYYGEEVEVINCNPYLESEDIKGRYIAKANKEGTGLNIEWLKSRIHEALERKAWIVFEEINFLNPALYSTLFGLLDFNKELVLTEHEGERIKSEETRIFSTLNLGYAGVNDISKNPAFLRRVGQIVLDLDYLKPEEEAKIIEAKTGLVYNEALKICKFVNQLRKEKDEGSADYHDVGMSIVETCAELIKNGLGSIKEALECTLINYLSESEEEKKALREKLSLFIND